MAKLPKVLIVDHERVNRLREYAAENGSLTNLSKADPPLYQWMFLRRHLPMVTLVSAELDSVSSDWRGETMRPRISPEERIASVVEYIKTHGSTSGMGSRNPSLYQWMNKCNSDANYSKHGLQLDKLAPGWRPKKQYVKIAADTIDEFQEALSAYGSLEVIKQEKPHLYEWVKRQRHNSANSLPVQELNRLVPNWIEVVGEVVKVPEDESQVRKLEEYVSKNGSLAGLKTHDRRLYAWLSHRRKLVNSTPAIRLLDERVPIWRDRPPVVRSPRPTVSTKMSKSNQKRLSRTIEVQMQAILDHNMVNSGKDAIVCSCGDLFWPPFVYNIHRAYESLKAVDSDSLTRMMGYGVDNVNGACYVNPSNGKLYVNDDGWKDQLGYPIRKPNGKKLVRLK